MNNKIVIKTLSEPQFNCAGGYTAILILPKVRANTRFAPTSNAGSRTIAGANAKMRIAGRYRV